MWKGKQNFKYQNTKYLTYSSRTGRSERNNDHYYRGNYNTGESSKKQAQEGCNVNTQQQAEEFSFCLREIMKRLEMIERDRFGARAPNRS